MIGEELRRAVAVEVMGWTLSEPKRFIGRETVYWVSGGDEVAIASGGSMVDTECGIDVFWPDTDWAAFGLVVEKMRLTIGDAGRFGWYAGLGEDGDWDCWSLYAIGETPMIAGCRAALKAVRARGNGDE